MEEQADEWFNILDGDLAGEGTPYSSELSSPPVSDQEASGVFIPEPNIAVPVGKKKGGVGRKVASKGGLKDEDDGEIADTRVGINGNRTAKKTTTVKKKLQVKRTKIDEDDEGMESEVEEPEERPPPVNSDYVPIPWKGRLGFACLNTYLRYSNPPIFCSRTCRIDTILKHGTEGQKYVESLGLANARDLVKLIHWNERYGIKFLRISSEMFPFASHSVYGYSLEFAKDVLAEAGKAAMKYGHRLSMHPGQFTQFGSPRKEVVENAVRDVEYHIQLLGYLGLTGQADKDAVMILHMGGMFGDKEATLQRFRGNYALLSPQVKARLVLENDDMCWSVHDLLPVCKELNIPLVLDWHHHNLNRDPSMREGSLDILQLIPEIKETWTRKGITQKQHYSESRGGTVTHKERRRHSARVLTLPPCENTMDLMIEAKDKEQAVFELMRKFKIPGWEKIQDVIPHVREDENKAVPKKRALKKPKKAKKVQMRRKNGAEEDEEEVEQAENQVKEVLVPVPEPMVQLISEREIGMGGVEGRVYWPEGKEDWLSPPKRPRINKAEAEEGAVSGTEEGAEADEKKPKRVAKKTKRSAAGKIEAEEDGDHEMDREIATATPPPKRVRRAKKSSTPSVVGKTTIPPPANVSQMRKPAAVKMEKQDSEVTPAPVALRKGKRAVVNRERISVAQVSDMVVPLTTTGSLVDGEVGQRRSRRVKKAVRHMELGEGELGEGDIGMEAEA
ncbi:UV-endonuclease UvdE-domain-containing protein [Terfezia claveryi]|nr:UV-endonuclease UvdE-domain-containing protein [Terfezia claveryi]